MSDNTQLGIPIGTGDVISTEDVGGGVKLPRGKIALGAADVDGGDVTVTNPLPVQWSDGTNGLGTVAHPAVVTTPSIGATGAAVPTSATEIGASDGANLQALRGSASTPSGSEFGLITRPIPSGVQGVSLPVSSTGTGSSVAGATGTTQLLAANGSRKGATIYNESTATLYLALGFAASPTTYTLQVQSSGYYELPFNYTGIINGAWASATGNARITELT